MSIVIPSYNDVPLLTEALASIAETVTGIDYEVLIVDDYIDEAVSAQLRAFESERVRVIFKAERRGFAGTVNVGMQQAKHDIVLLNSDIVAKRGWLEALQYSAYAIDPKIGLVSGMLVYPDGRIQYGGTYYARLLAPQWFGHLNVGAPATKPAANVPGYNTSISGACVYITREAFERVGLLDDEFWLGFEDVDYGLRAWERGIRCYFQPAALLVHHESASRGYSQGHRELASMRRFWRRWEEKYLTRRVPLDAPVSFVTGPASDGLWEAYVDFLADTARASGRDAEVYRTEDRDEALIERLAERGGTVVACDWTVAQTVWLATARAGLPVYLLPAMESGAHPDDPARQAAIVAGYRPEFDYIAPNRFVQRQLQAEAAWEVRARIPPALPPQALPDEAASVVLVVGAGSVELAAVRAVAHAHGRTVVAVPDIPTRRALADAHALRPRAVVDFGAHASSLVPYALMSLGGVLVAPVNPVLSHEVLDGYNALLFAGGDLDAMARSLGDALRLDDAWRELRANGHASAARAASSASVELPRALASFADVIA
ncbi:glycosyltransferase family 2 protein [Microbacterium sp. BK668]|uniref:glycosyltransferase family 2 protein n=1 Tax=Microbacterium sp. BK668 TaxID=2512118 RepID=UPI001414CC90|nr:glycosyltransferase family 2 protein [Microbacterium sp. BK668]